MTVHEDLLQIHCVSEKYQVIKRVWILTDTDIIDLCFYYCVPMKCHRKIYQERSHLESFHLWVNWPHPPSTMWEHLSFRGWAVPAAATVEAEGGVCLHCNFASSNSVFPLPFSQKTWRLDLVLNTKMWSGKYWENDWQLWFCVQRFFGTYVYVHTLFSIVSLAVMNKAEDIWKAYMCAYDQFQSVTIVCFL